MFEIRKASIDDSEGIVKVHIDVWKTTYTGIINEEYLNMASGSCMR